MLAYDHEEVPGTPYCQQEAMRLFNLDAFDVCVMLRVCEVLERGAWRLVSSG